MKARHPTIASKKITRAADHRPIVAGSDFDAAASGQANLRLALRDGALCAPLASARALR
jgi:hypothetical protein